MKTPGSGRQKGTPNKRDAELRAVIFEKTKGHAYFVDKLMSFIDHAREQGVKLQAFTKLMEYAYGKPAQQVELTGEDGGPVKFTIITGVPDPDGKHD